MRIWRFWIPLVVSCLITTSCSLSRFGYDLAPSLLIWRIESYVTLDDAQRDLLVRHVDALHLWHRDTQLTRYARLLREVDDGMRSEVDARTVGRWRAEVMDWWPAFAERLAPGLVVFARTLTVAQLFEIRASLDESERKHQAEFKPALAEALLDARVKRLRKRAEFFLGELNDGQLARLRLMAADLPATEAAWLAERSRRNRQLLMLIESLASRESTQSQAIEQASLVLAGLWASPAPEHVDAIAAARSAADEVYARLFNSATAEQHEQMHERLMAWIADAKSLAGQQ